ncbi:MAG TPA: hypothetical protein VI876_01640 [Dehalococcoidia bacterium]|nr:hypothetical protein [Dehalococcoidia bacterium]
MAKVNVVREALANEAQINSVLQDMNARGFELVQVLERGTLDMMGNRGVLLFFQSNQRISAAKVAPRKPASRPLSPEVYAAAV